MATLFHPIYDHYGKSMLQEEARADLSLDNDTQYILFFGLIRAYKGLDTLIECLPQIKTEKKFKLIVAGEFYENESKYSKLIEEHNVSDKIKIVNQYIPNEEVPKYFCAADFVVLPYKRATQSGVVPIAIHFEKPIVVTNVGGLSAVIENNKIGLIADATVESLLKKSVCALKAMLSRMPILQLFVRVYRGKVFIITLFKKLMTMDSNIKNLISDHLSVVDTMLKDDALLSKIDTLITLIVDAYRQGKKVFFCGNGGSAADAEHIAAELSGRFKMDRAALFAEALHVNGAALTAIANDYGYHKSFLENVGS